MGLTAALVGFIVMPGTAEAADRADDKFGIHAINCTDLGNGVLCINPSGVQGGNGLVDVWYDKRAGAPVTVDLGYIETHSNTIQMRNIKETVSRGQRSFHSFTEYFDGSGECFHPKMFVPYDGWYTGAASCTF